LIINVTIAAKERTKALSGMGTLSPKPILFQPSGVDGATVEEIQRWLSPFSNVSVIKFHSMYDVLSRKQFEKDKQFKVLRNRINLGFVCSEYEQWEKSGLEFVNPEM